MMKERSVRPLKRSLQDNPQSVEDYHNGKDKSNRLPSRTDHESHERKSKSGYGKPDPEGIAVNKIKMYCKEQIQDYMRAHPVFIGTCGICQKETLDKLIYAHQTAIPFENLDVYEYHKSIFTETGGSVSEDGHRPQRWILL